jgi:hypothetical protein
MPRWCSRYIIKHLASFTLRVYIFKLVAKLGQIEGGAIALWVHRVESYGCKYGEKLDKYTVFSKFWGCISTP